MTAPTWVWECLPLITLLGKRFEAELAGISVEDWHRPSNCEGWLVNDFAAHLTFGAKYFGDALAGALARDPQPLWAPSEVARSQRMASVRRETPAEAAPLFVQESAALDARYASVTEAELDLPAWHITGARTVWRYMTMRPYELALHTWDMRTSLGLPAAVPPEAEPLLVAMMTEVVLPGMVNKDALAGLEASVAFDLGNGRRPGWRISGGQVQPGVPTSSEVVIHTSANHFILAFSGRADWPGPATFEGDAALGGRLQALFRRF